MSSVPEPVARLAELMASFGRPWFLCGGWAVDAWLGRQSRDHHDVDIAVFQDDLPVLFEHFSAWRLIAHDPNVPDDTTQPWDGRRLDLPAHIHARREADIDLEILLNARPGPDWVLNRDPRVTLPLGRCFGQSVWGLPALVPSVLLFYKATAYAEFRPQDDLDLRSLLVQLDAEERAWLHEVVGLVRPGHPWLPELGP